MLAWINWEPGGLPRVRRRVELLNGMPLCRVEIGGRITPLLRLFLRRERRILREAGVRQGVWADGLPELLQLELTAVDVTPLRRAILPALLEQAFRQKRMTERTASVRLTRRVRYLRLDTGCGQKALEDWLLSRYGLACGGAEPELEVTLRREGDASALLLGENCLRQRVDYILPPHLEGTIPGGGEGERLLAALYRQERLRPGELAVRRIHFSA